MKAQAFVFARGGSKGIPRKNTRLLGGVPLIVHSIRSALSCRSLGSVIVSTDDEEIAEISREAGADVPFMRPAELASDTAPEWLAWKHAIEWVRTNRGPFDAFVSLPPTSPFRSMEDIENCITALRNDMQADAVITVQTANRSPYFNMVTLDETGSAGLVIPPTTEIARRQDAPKVYDMTTVAYVARPDFVLRSRSLFPGRILAVEVPAERALDIDTPFDFAIAQAIANGIAASDN